MTDFEIYQLAQNIASSITNDLDASRYAELKGSLSVSWISKPKKFNAWAEEFFDFAETQLTTDAFKPVFGDLHPIPFPSSFSKENSVKNIFIASFTWVYFHELGHAAQEHGHVRHIFGGKLKPLKQSRNAMPTLQRKLLALQIGYPT